MTARDDLFAANRAIYLPAINKNFAEFARGGTFARELPWTADKLNFLNRANADFFHYPYALYSAGQAERAEKRTVIKPCIVADRDRADTIIVGDSGGFQVQQDTITFKGDATTRRLMKWMEAHADYSMVLDFPTGGIGSGNMLSHAERLTGDGVDLVSLSAANGQPIDFNACLAQTQRNNRLFEEERAPNATKFLNVLQGRNEAESSTWLREITTGPSFEGWAFAGAHHDNLRIILRRLLDMRASGQLEKCEWLHVLGQASLEFGVVLTSIQRAVRQTANPNFQISFDAASPFIMAGKFQIYSALTSDKQGWAMRNLNLAGSGRASDRRTIAEVCASETPSSPARNWRFQERFVTPAETAVASLPISALFGTPDDQTPDTTGVMVAAHHNVQAYTSAHDAAHFVYETDRLGPQLPPKVRIADTIVQQVFGLCQYAPADPIAHIEECAAQLEAFV